MAGSNGAAGSAEKHEASITPCDANERAWDVVRKTTARRVAGATAIYAASKSSPILRAEIRKRDGDCGDVSDRGRLKKAAICRSEADIVPGHRDQSRHPARFGNQSHCEQQRTFAFEAARCAGDGGNRVGIGRRLGHDSTAKGCRNASSKSKTLSKSSRRSSAVFRICPIRNRLNTISPISPVLRIPHELSTVLAINPN